MQLLPVRQMPPFDWLTIVTPLVSGESTFHQVTGYELRVILFEARSTIENFSAFCHVLRGSILLPPCYPRVFPRMAR